MTLFVDPARFPAAADAAQAQMGVERWCDAARDLGEDSAFATALAADPGGRRVLDAVFGNSPFLSQAMLREPAFACAVLRDGPEAGFASLLAGMRDTLAGEDAQPALMQGLRRAKRRAALLIALADIGEVWTVERVTQALSDFADLALSLALRQQLRAAAAAGAIRLPDPADAERGCGVAVFAMGKLGAQELNYSSDIDLMVLFDPEVVQTDRPDRLTTELVRLTRQLMRIMDERTADGYVFRTDLRIRPDPGATPLAISIPAAEAYYESVGQNWERAALIRARPAAGDADVGETFLHTLRPFVWRKNLDFAAIEDIHSIKRQITAFRGGGRIAIEGHNIKLGRGGIREIEFYAHTQQLIWGGRIPELRIRPLVPALEALAEHGKITPESARDLSAAYRFLRRLEHRLQMVSDEQTHQLPKTEEEVDRIGVFMGYADPAAFRAELRGYMECVERHYGHLFEEASDLGGSGTLVFTGGEADPETVRTLESMGFADGVSMSAVIRQWHHGRYRATRSERARQILTELMPRLLEALSRTANPSAAFSRFDQFLSNLPAGVQLLALFHANPPLLDVVADIMGDAPRLADRLSRNPHLLDHVLTEDFFAPVGDAPDLKDGLTAALGQADDYQDVLDITRRWTNDMKFQIGTQILRGAIDGEAAGRPLSDIADVVLSALWPRVEAEFQRAHGQVAGGGMAVLAFGKLGGREMAPESDLDLVFVYDHDEEAEQSDGARPLFPNVYYMRASQRLVGGITAPTGEGMLYEVDTRLRPDGNKGPAAARLQGFARYYEDAAWTWEHMALTRARVVIAPPHLRTALEDVIRRTLTRPRDPAKLVVDVSDMRARMAREHRDPSPWRIKHRRGGLVDIEFLAQYLQLLHAAEKPEILSPNTAEALTRLRDAGCLDAGTAADLLDALALWRRLQSVIRLTVEGVFDEDKATPGLRNAITRAGKIEGGLDDLKRRMDATAGRVLERFEELVERPAAAVREQDRPNEGR
ncbi:MAG: bifunctional [glutamine synthetase] adenylyltransferase/[glutamine synthetase]-adenylyl-L-tyrosine phosphorylase [Alphaproteobacteria bacterium]